MILRLVIASVFAVAVASNALHYLLMEKLQHFGNAKDFKLQLGLVSDELRKLLERHTATQDLTDNVNLLRRLRNASHPSTSMYELLKNLGMVDNLADSHPLVAILCRRAYLASVILRWMALGQKPLEDELEQELAAIASEFYRIHVRSVIRRGLIEYLHISKSGGTSFSAAAKHAHCQMSRGIGQLEALGDLPRWIVGQQFENFTGTDIMWSYYSAGGRPEEGQGCSKRVAHIAARGYNYVSNEFTLHGGGGDGGSSSGGGSGRRSTAAAIDRNSTLSMLSTHVCPQLVNVVTLREPGGRLTSHLHYMLARIKKRVDLKDGLGGKRFFELFCAGDVGVWERVAPTVIDNYIVRSFVGEAAFHTPLGGIGHDHVEVARRLLLQFDLVLDLDAGEEAEDLIIQQGLGWGVQMSQLHVRSSSSTFAKLNYSKEDCPNDKLLGLLLPRQDPDRQLYSTGRTLALLDAIFLEVAHVMGLRPNTLATEEDAAAFNTGNTTDTDADAKGAASCGLLHYAPGGPAAAAAAAKGHALGIAGASSRARSTRPRTAGGERDARRLLPLLRGRGHRGR